MILVSTLLKNLGFDLTSNILMYRYLYLFAPIQLLFGVVVNVSATEITDPVAVTTPETFGFIILVCAGIGLLYRANFRRLQLKRVRIRRRCR